MRGDRRGKAILIYTPFDKSSKGKLFRETVSKKMQANIDIGKGNIFVFRMIFRGPGDLEEFTKQIPGFSDSSPEEKELTVSDIIKLNPELFGERDSQNPEAVMTPQKFHQELVAVPLWRYTRDPQTGQLYPISSGDARRIKSWQEKGVDGKYNPRGEFLEDRPDPVLVMRRDALGETLRGNKTSVHEAGHAYVFSIEKLDSAFFEVYQQKREDAYVRALQKGPPGSLTAYADKTEKEFEAESFAAYYSSPTSRAILKALDPEWYHTVESLIQHAKTLVP